MNSRYRHGLTLTELLVVGTIILAVTAISIPVVKPMMESQLTKNGANMVATALNRARNRAMANGRACGIRFEYWPGTYFDPVNSDSPYLRNITYYPVYAPLYDYQDPEKNITDYDPDGIVCYYPPGASLILRQIEVPPVYTGLLGTEKVTINDGVCAFEDEYIREKLKHVSNARIQFGGSGPFYKINNEFALEDGQTYALPPNREYQSFKILLESRATMAMPVFLPRGTAVDLQFSGVGDSIFIDTEYYDVARNKSLTIMFAPDGSVESVNGVIPTEPVHFLIGRWDQISDVRDEGDEESYPNYADGRNYWVSVFPQTGSVAVNQVNPTQDFGYAPYDQNPDNQRVKDYNGTVYVIPDVRLPSTKEVNGEMVELPKGVIATSRELAQ